MHSERATAGRRSKVLVVDDEQDIRDMMAQVLEQEGYDVDTASDGREALTLLMTRPPPDVMVLDLMLPVMTGWALLEALRDRPQLARLPTVVVSASHEPPPVDQAQRFLAKPFRVEVLLAAIAECCASNASGRLASSEARLA